MRTLSWIQLDELESTSGVAINLELGYARRLAQVAANKYGRRIPLFEDTTKRETSTARFLVGYSHTHANLLIEVFELDRDVDTQGLRLGYGAMTPHDSAVAWNPITDIPEGNRPSKRFNIGDRINYTKTEGWSLWDNSVVTGIVAHGTFAGQLEVTAPNGLSGIIAQDEAELRTDEVIHSTARGVSLGPIGVFPIFEQRQADDLAAAQGPTEAEAEAFVLAGQPRDRGDGTSQLVSVYELVPQIESDGYEAESVYRRHLTRSAPIPLRDENLYGDALVELVAQENDLLYESLFVMFKADLFEADNEGRIL